MPGASGLCAVRAREFCPIALCPSIPGPWSGAGGRDPGEVANSPFPCPKCLDVQSLRKRASSPTATRSVANSRAAPWSPAWKHASCNASSVEAELRDRVCTFMSPFHIRKMRFRGPGLPVTCDTSFPCEQAPGIRGGRDDEPWHRRCSARRGRGGGYS
jgi:hypothetical protein